MPDRCHALRVASIPRRVVARARWALLALLALLASVGLWAGPGAHAQLVEEVPFITTPDNVTLALLQLAGVGPQDHVIDLGSGDGRIVITAARRFGASGLGVEIVPDLVARSRRNAEQAGVAARVAFREQDLSRPTSAPPPSSRCTCCPKSTCSCARRC